MPIYEYLCPGCHKIFEEWTSSANDDTAEACPRCGVPAPRVMSQTSFVLKGDGWYVSDYGYRKGIKEDGKEASGAETKPADKDAKTVGEKTPADAGQKTAEASPVKAEKPGQPAKTNDAPKVESRTAEAS